MTRASGPSCSSASEPIKQTLPGVKAAALARGAQDRLVRWIVPLSLVLPIPAILLLPIPDWLFSSADPCYSCGCPALQGDIRWGWGDPMWRVELAVLQPGDRCVLVLSTADVEVHASVTNQHKSGKLGWVQFVNYQRSGSYTECVNAEDCPGVVPCPMTCLKEEADVLDCNRACMPWTACPCDVPCGSDGRTRFLDLPHIILFDFGSPHRVGCNFSWDDAYVLALVWLCEGKYKIIGSVTWYTRGTLSLRPEVEYVCKFSQSFGRCVLDDPGQLYYAHRGCNLDYGHSEFVLEHCVELDIAGYTGPCEWDVPLDSGPEYCPETCP